jgi:hypothetical protein
MSTGYLVYRTLPTIDEVSAFTLKFLHVAELMLKAVVQTLSNTEVFDVNSFHGRLKD